MEVFQNLKYIPFVWIQEWHLGIEAPPAMIEIIGDITPRPVMLVAGGKAQTHLGSEVPHATYYAEYAGNNAQVWVVPDAVHYNGSQRYPEMYAFRLVNFF
jgi:hypothetical protein